LSPVHTVDLVMVWSEHDDSPPAVAFRNLVSAWQKRGLLWEKTSGAKVPGRC
jgi:hypothetical protein